MKACIEKNGAVHILTLTPESAEDELSLALFSEATMRATLLNCRGFKYLRREVEFYIQPMPSKD